MNKKKINEYTRALNHIRNAWIIIRNANTIKTKGGYDGVDCEIYKKTEELVFMTKEYIELLDRWENKQ